MIAPRYWREIPQCYRYDAARCKSCGRITFPPRLICPECKSRAFESIKFSGKGEVLSYTIIRVPPAQFVAQAPYAIAIIQLEEGARVTAQLADCDLEKIHIGMKVQIAFRRIQEEGEDGVICYGYKFVPQG